MNLILCFTCASADYTRFILKVIQNDLDNGICDAKDIVCLVVDEAHRASGQYAYCQVVKKIHSTNKEFRVLALTATPGSDTKTVQHVIDNLLISHIEVRTEESFDCQAYMHVRTKEIVVVPASEFVMKYAKLFEAILQPPLETLYRHQVFHEKEASKVNKFMLLTSRDRMRHRPGLSKSVTSQCEGHFGLLMTLFHAYDLLMRHGEFQQIIRSRSLSFDACLIFSTPRCHPLFPLYERTEDCTISIGIGRIESRCQPFEFT